MRLDLHCHSTHSDGSLPAAQVAAAAQKFGVELFCLTDHDTWAGYDATIDVLGGTGCTVLRGVELSCREYGRTVHLLVYGLREGEGLQKFEVMLEGIIEQRRERLRKICARLDKLGVHLDADAIVSKTHDRTPGRPDVARALVEARVCTSPKEAFTRFLRDGGPADVPIKRLSVEDGIAMGKAAGAKMSIAHPHTLGDPALVRDLFVRLRDAGLEGIEAYYGKYAEAERLGWLRLAKELDLVPTGGSDFHGDMSPDVARPGIELPKEATRRLLDWLEVA